MKMWIENTHQLVTQKMHDDQDLDLAINTLYRKKTATKNQNQTLYSLCETDLLIFFVKSDVLFYSMKNILLGLCVYKK